MQKIFLNAEAALDGLLSDGMTIAAVLADLARRAVQHHRALIAEIDLHPLAGYPCAILLHLRDEFLLGHRLLSPLSAAVAAAFSPIKDGQLSRPV